MSIQIQKGKVTRPQKVVLYAPEGIGKSTVASQLPEPLFVDLEQGTHHLDVARVEPKTLNDVESLLAQIAQKKVTGFKTLVIDTIDWLEELAAKQLCADANKSSIEDFGYGKGYVHLAEKISGVLDKLDAVAAAGLHVVLLAHSEVKKFEQPDDAKAYDRYSLKLTKQVGPLIKEWCDALLFANWKTLVKDPDEGKAKGMGGRERVLYATHTASWDAKNRHELRDKEPFGVETLHKILGAEVPGIAATATASERGGSASASEQGVAATPPPSQSIPAAAHAVTAVEDHVPGLDSPQEQVAKLLEPHKARALEWLVKNGKLKAGQLFADLTTDFANRILKRPYDFVATVNGEKGGAK